jgi:hypothetical protein
MELKPQHYPLEEIAGRQEIKGISHDGREIALTANQWEFLHTMDIMTEELAPRMKADRDFMHRMKFTDGTNL